jgi:hypothetical protein
MKIFRVSFIGRRSGALGVFGRIYLPLIQADSREDAKKLAFELIYPDSGACSGNGGFEMFSQELTIDESA